jgi:hypothetical protein
MGNPYEPSPKARLKAALGMGYPFDRHDWFVDRGGAQKHYIIDYYFNPKGEALGDKPSPCDADAQFTRQIYVDVRPAIESVGDVIDRLVAFPGRAVAAFNRPRFVADGIDPATAPKEELQKPKYSSDKHSDASPSSSSSPSSAVAPAAATAQKIEGHINQHHHHHQRLRTPIGADGIDWDAVDSKCRPLLDGLKGAKSEDERRSASVALNYCMGRALCPGEASAFMKALEANTAAGKEGEAGSDEAIAFEAMTKCVTGKVAARPRALPTAPAEASVAGSQLK